MANTIKCPHCGKTFDAPIISPEVEKKLRAEIESEKNIELTDLKKALDEQKAKNDEFRYKDFSPGFPEFTEACRE